VWHLARAAAVLQLFSVVTCHAAAARIDGDDVYVSTAFRRTVLPLSAYCGLRVCCKHAVL